MHEDLWSPRGEAGEAQHEAVRVGGGKNELPERQAEAPRQLLRRIDRSLRWEHRRCAARKLFGNGTHDRLRRVPCHRGGVTEGEVEVARTVGISDLCSEGAHREGWNWRRPSLHPWHRHATH